MKKIFYMVPFVLLLLCMSVYAGVTWTCPVAGSSTSSTVKTYAEYTDDGVYTKCNSGGNNLTIEFSVDAETSDFPANEGAGTYANATLYIYRGSDRKFMLPLSSNFTNGTMIRWTDFGEIATSNAGGAVVGYPKWYQNLTEGSYKWWVQVELENGTLGGGTQLFSTTTGFDDSYAVPFTIDLEESAGNKLAGAVQSGAQVDAGTAALFGGVSGFGGRIPRTVVVAFLLVVIYFVFFKKQ